MFQCARAAVVGTVIAAAIVSVSAQAKPSGTKPVMYDMTVNADGLYTGTTEIAVDRGKVTGDLRLTGPNEVTGKVAGTAKDGVLYLDFPYQMPQRNCTGNVKMTITMPAKPGLAKGTMEATSCGSDDGSKVTGTVEMTPASLNTGRKG